MTMVLLLYCYGVIVLLLGVFGIINIMHLVLHSMFTKMSVFMTILFVAGFGVTLLFSMSALSTIVWNTPLFNNASAPTQLF